MYGIIECRKKFRILVILEIKKNQYTAGLNMDICISLIPVILD